MAALPGGFHAAVDVAIATFAGLSAVLVFWPILIVTKAIKVPFRVRRVPLSVRPSSGEHIP